MGSTYGELVESDASSFLMGLHRPLRSGDMVNRVFRADSLLCLRTVRLIKDRHLPQRGTHYSTSFLRLALVGLTGVESWHRPDTLMRSRVHQETYILIARPLRVHLRQVWNCGDESQQLSRGQTRGLRHVQIFTSYRLACVCMEGGKP